MSDGEHVTADERFFLVKSADASLSREGWAALEQEVMTEHKWWSREELAQTSATVWPDNLLAMLDAATRPERSNPEPR
jgi:8-oxo-dGTP diphosphatase